MSAYRTWYALVLFIVYIGGVIVSFSYFICLRPKHKGSAPLWVMFPMAVVCSTLEYRQKCELSKGVEVYDFLCF